MIQKTDIYLVSSPPVSPIKNMINRSIGVLPVGLASIGAVLLENGYSVKAADLFNSQITASSFRAVIEEVNPRIVGFSAATETYSNAIRLARICKQVDSNIIVIIGGPHVTFLAEQTLKESAIDIVVQGEGEFTMLELAGYFIRGYGALHKIKGISYRHNGCLKMNSYRSFIKQLDDIPFLSRSLFVDNYSVPGNILSSRGCPARCIFCAAAAMSGGKYRTHSAEHVIDEIMYLQHNGFGDTIKFLDDTVTADVRRLEIILSFMERLNVNIKWGIESRVDVITKHLLERIAQLGCLSVQFGVESGSQEILDKISKGISLEQVMRVVEWAANTLKHVCCSFIIGHPFDTEQTVRETIDLGFKLQNEFCVQVLFSIATPYPGTYLYNHAEKLGLNNLSYNYDDYNFLNPVFDTAHLSKQELRNLQYEAVQKMFTAMPEKLMKHYKSHEDFIQELL